MSTTTVETKAVQEKPLKWTTCAVPPTNFRLPKDFKLPPGLEAVPVSQDSPTEVPQATSRDYSNYKYKHYLPYNTVTAEPPLTPYDHIDPGSRADPSKKSLFSAIPQKRDMTPNLGTEIHGCQLSSLTDTQKDELALYAAERGLLVFRDQDFVDYGAEWMKAYGSYFGRLHVHPFGTHVKDHPELVTNFRDRDDTFFDANSRDMLTTTRFHSDMSYEVNTVGTTFLCSLNGPPTGGDTLYLSTTAAYRALSPSMQRFLSTLTAIHSGTRQSITSSTTNLYRRAPIDTVHPVIRTHPVTGQKAIWVNREYTTRIVELKKEESDAILGLLLDHLERSLDFHTRVRWEPGTVVVYDNRIVLHSIVLDYDLRNEQGEDKDGSINGMRHIIRVTPQAEKPFFK